MPSRFNFNFGGTPSPEFGLPQVSFGRNNGHGPWDLDQTENQFETDPSVTAAAARVPQTSAFDKFMKTQNEMPIYGDKQYERGNWGKLGALLAGSTVGGLTGDVDRGTSVAKNILDTKFNRAMTGWQQRFKTNQAGAIEERQREESFRKGRLDQSNIEKNEAETAALNETKGLNRQEKEARIKASLATAGVNEARTSQIWDDINNPETKVIANNKGGLTVLDKGGNVLRTHEGVSLSAKQLKDIDQKNDLTKIHEQGNIGDRHLATQLKGFGELENTRQGNRKELEGIQQAGKERLQKLNADSRLGLQDDAQAFKEAHSATEVKSRLSSPQFQREVNAEFNRLVGTDPATKQQVRDHFSVDAKGNYFLTDTEDSDGLDLMNSIMRRLNSKGIR